ncbi:MAG: 30S ribosome-binding factor RbfA [Clostridia bacterium]|nr:30S ribosome-binding factor RbfA [Clostridia bacterium]
MERTERIEEEIKKIAGRLIDQELKDPRLTGIISVTKVYVSRDLKYCKIFVSMLGTVDEKEAMDALKSSAGFVRREIGNNIRMHSTPEVKFEMDDSMAYGEKIQGIINSLDIKPIEDDESADESDF